MPITLNGDTGITTPLDVEIQGSTSGSITLAAPAVAGSSVITFPVGTGTASVRGLSTNIVASTAVASTSGTSIDFTGIPSWVRRITVMFNGFSTNGTSSYLVQIGSGSITTSGYLSSSSVAGGTNVAASISSTAGFIIFSSLAANIIYGKLEILLLSGSTYLSTQTAGLNQSSVYYGYTGGGNVTLSGVLDRLRITTVNGTDTFDAGTVNILYE